MSVMRETRMMWTGVAACLALAGLAGCGTPASTATAWGGSAVFAGAHSPNNEIEQIYYVGSFDPQGQLPPEMYRIRVRGQASAFSLTRFASGWVKADVIDSLGSGVGFTEHGAASVTRATGDADTGAVPVGRRLVLFGPEGFLEAPSDHRLVIIMGANPEDFFNAIDQSLGAVAEVQRDRLEAEVAQAVLEEMLRLQTESSELASVAQTLNAIGASQ